MLWPAHLAPNKERPEMDEQEKTVLRSLLDKKIAERDRLTLFIDTIAAELGEPVPSGPSGNGSPTVTRSGARLGADPVASTNEGEYFSFTSTDAAREILTKYGDRQHPIKTSVLYQALKKGGVTISSEDVLYRSLARSNRFRKVGRGLWGLSDWYPTSAKQPASKREPDMSNVTNLEPPAPFVVDTDGEVSHGDEDAEVNSA
jgi:hypothetical protein